VRAVSVSVRVRGAAIGACRTCLVALGDERLGSQGKALIVAAVCNSFSSV
jgi:hypothetical protein